MEREIIVKIKTINSTTFPITIYSNSSISDLKQKIFSKVRISSLNQRLIFQGKVLKNENSICDYNIEDNDVIHLVETDGRNYQPPPTTTNYDEENNNDNSFALFNFLIGSQLSRLSQTNQNNNNNPNTITSVNNNNNRNENNDDIYESFKHLMFPSTFNKAETTEVIKQNMNLLFNMIDTATYINLDISKKLVNLFNKDLSEIQFKVGQWVDYKCATEEWIEAQIIAVSENSVKLHYLGSRMLSTEWIGKSSERLALFRTYTTQDVSGKNKYYSCFPSKKDRNNDGYLLTYTKVNKFTSLDNELVMLFDCIKEKIVKIINQREVRNRKNYNSRDEFFDNERYEMLLIFQLYPILDRFGRLITDISYYLMNESYNYFGNNTQLFRNNLYDKTLRFLNMYDSSETVMKNRLIQYQNLTCMSILRNRMNERENENSNRESNGTQRVRYLVNFNSLRRTREQEREEQRRRAMRYIVGRENFSFIGRGVVSYNVASQTERVVNVNMNRNWCIDKGAERITIEGKGSEIKDIKNLKESIEIKEEKNIQRTNLKKSKRYSINAKNKTSSVIPQKADRKRTVGNCVRSGKYRLSKAKGKIIDKD